MRLLPEPPGRILQHARHLDQGHHLLHGCRGIDQDAVHLALGDRPAELEPLRALQDSADIFRLDGKKNCRHGQVFTNLTFIPRMWAFPGSVGPCHPSPGRAISQGAPCAPVAPPRRSCNGAAQARLRPKGSLSLTRMQNKTLTSSQKYILTTDFKRKHKMIEITLAEKISNQLSSYQGKISCICIQSSSTESIFQCNMQQYGNVYPISFKLNIEIASQFTDKYAKKISELLIMNYHTISNKNAAYISKMASHNIEAELTIEADTF